MADLLGAFDWELTVVFNFFKAPRTTLGDFGVLAVGAGVAALAVGAGVAALAVGAGVAALAVGAGVVFSKHISI